MVEYGYIKNYVGEDSCNTGRNYYNNFINYDYKEISKNQSHSFYFTVVSMSHKGKYEVIIQIKDNEIINTNCNCRQFIDFHISF